MNSETYDLVIDLLIQAKDQSGKAKVSILEQAARLADQSRDMNLMLQVRADLFLGLLVTGQIHKLLPLLAWLRARAKHPQARVLLDMVYPVVLEEVPGLPRLAVREIRSLLDDYLSLVPETLEGEFLKTYARWMVYWGIRDLSPAEHELARLDDYSSLKLDHPCPVCVSARRVRFLIDSERLSEAHLRAAPFVRGTVSCGTNRVEVLSAMMWSALKTGNLCRAATYRQEIGAQIWDDHTLSLASCGPQLTFLALFGKWDEGTRFIERHLNRAIDSQRASQQFEFFLGAWFFFARMHQAGHCTARLFVTPPCPLKSHTGLFELPKLIQWFERKSRDLATALDSRNHNDWFARRIEAQWHIHHDQLEAKQMCDVFANT